ncbi:MAG: hypothetical protein ACK2UK_05800 [Candidatus Promineifilaceae bacterium]
MQPSEEFTGLGMPVFTAFGWAGEENAQQYAFSQIEQFAALLHDALSAALQNELPYHGLSREDKSAFLAAAENVEEDLHISFNARPTSLEIQIALTDKAALMRGLKQVAKDPQGFLLLLQQLDPQWTLRIQQLLVDEESGGQSHYQELLRGPIAELTPEEMVELIENVVYLNSQDKWITPIYLSFLVPAEQAAVMQGSIVPVTAERLEKTLPLIVTLRGRSAKKVVTAPELAGATVETPPPVPVELLEQPERPQSDEGFTFISELKPLHIERGFINMTPEYWPFFAINARTESRPVITISGDIRDEESAVWRLQPNDMARLVLGPRAQKWLSDHFVANEYVQLVVTREGDDEIEVVVEPVS